MNYQIDGNQVMATEHGFRNLKIDEAGFGDSLKEAFLHLARKPLHKPELRDLNSWEMDWYDELTTPTQLSKERKTMKDPKILEKIAMNIVHQIGDELNVSIEVRQGTNDKCINFVLELLEEAVAASQDNESETNEDMHNMGLLESITTADRVITRVPGGWVLSEIYHRSGVLEGVSDPVFIPLSYEFDKKTRFIANFKFPAIDGSPRYIYNKITIPVDCQINCQHLDEDDQGEERESIFNCTIKDIEKCPIVIRDMEK